ncbi:bacteriocin ABC transporter ATP-binding protein [Globicatella sp. HMSC072A10]|uniref:ABC transporter ATP-binding protein n=1 Tax=Globicatella sp. HMSC072A10 TaxID=1739315 RepID=UPI0008B4D189|nr:ABC transporter ATP-binding protein [Globicatella sp. HMSC072A10]OFK55188.1 bacteriocin ABC transporter ATP-binding protein [Globicatella sp. HMSC072A10]
MSLLKIQNVEKVYGKKGFGVLTKALKKVNFEVNEGEFVSIMGESGSGKTTLLNIIATLDQPTNGQVLLNNLPLSEIKSKDIAKFRRERLGFVFQDFNVLNNFNNKDNILLPLVLSEKKITEMEQRLSEITPILGIESLLEKFPYQISGGQRQRIAIARAIITQPDILLADEPTGALDSKTSQTILELFQSLNEMGQTILMVTHSIKAAAMSNRVLFIKDGIIFHEIYRGNDSVQAFQERIADSLTAMNQGGE